MKFSRAVNGFFLDRGLQLAETTTANYRHYFALFQDFIGDKPIEDVTSRDVNAFLTYLSRERGLSDRTLHDVRARLSSLWTWAVTELDVDNVVAKVAKPTYRTREIVPYTQDELRLLLDAAEYDEGWRSPSGKLVRSKRATGLRDRAIILVLVDSGIRASELCKLLISDYDESRGRLHIQHGKGDKERHVVVGKRTQKALWRYLSTRAVTNPNDPLFASGTGGHIHRSTLFHTIQRFGI